MNRFNIRVYGLYIVGNQILVSKENIKGQSILKFPGGGLEFGEGTIECIQRECKEEMNIEVEVDQHFYTTDFFQPSAYDNSQVISIYYKIHPTESLTLPVITNREHFFMMDVDNELKLSMSLPIDKKVAALLLEK